MSLFHSCLLSPPWLSLWRENAVLIDVNSLSGNSLPFEGLHSTFALVTIVSARHSVISATVCGTYSNSKKKSFETLKH